MQSSFQGLENRFAVLTKGEFFFLVESCSPTVPALPVPTRLSPFLGLPYLVKIFYHFLHAFWNVRFIAHELAM